MAAAAVLTACGATAHPGAAAVVGDQRIAVTTLDSHLTAYRTALAAQAGGASEGSGLVRHTLQVLVESQLVDDALSARHLGVTPAEVQRERAAAVAQTGSEQALDQAFLQQIGLAPSDIDTYFRLTVGEQKLLRAEGVDPSSAQAGPAMTRILSETAARHRVTVNPRYGAWNAQQAAVGALTVPWIKDTTTRASS